MQIYDVRRAFSLKKYAFLLCIFILFAILLKLDVFVDIFLDTKVLEIDWIEKFILEILTDKSMLFLLPVLCAQIYASSFVDEYKSGILRFTFSRISRKRYLKSKILAVGLSGGFLLMILCIIAIFIFYGIFFLMADVEMVRQSTEKNAEVLLLNDRHMGFGYGCVQLVFRYFFMGSLGAMTGLYISAAVNHRYMAWISPFIAEYLLIIFCDRYAKNLYILNPVEWLSPSEQWPWNTWSVCIWLLLLTVLAACFFVRAAQRRLTDV